MSHVTRKPVLGVCDQYRLKPAFSATEAGKSHGFAGVATIDIILSRQRITEMLIRLRRWSGWFSLFAHGMNSFSHDVAQIKVTPILQP